MVSWQLCTPLFPFASVFVRSFQATTAINELRGAVDTLIVVANDKLLEITAANIPLERAFSVADDILRQVPSQHLSRFNVHAV